MRTPEWLLTRVRAHVALQKPRAAEGFAAYVTFVLEVVGQQMHGHRRHGNVDFPTRGALLRHLAVYTSVRLLVPAQVGRCGVGLAALGAGVPLGGSSGVPRRFPPRSSVHDKERVHGVTFAHSCIPVDVSAGRRRDLGPRAVRLVGITMDISMDTGVRVVDAPVDD